jgi:Ni,Fe-hydrogenase III small subunit/formate hydrogenlyase subunit 6/NADH:ubiquinone oxidoreductase subunit I
MFEILRKSLVTGVVTTRYPATPVDVAPNARGRPEIDWAKWQDARPAARICPTGAIEYADAAGVRTASLDLGKCVFCGLCADVDQAIRMTNQCELACLRRNGLITAASYALNPDGTHQRLSSGPNVAEGGPDLVSGPKTGSGLDTRSSPTSDAKNNLPVGPDLASGPSAPSIDTLGAQIRERTARLFGRSLHIREVDAGSCNGCEIEIVGLGSPIYDVERFGIHFVASPRHADLLLVTGPVTRNMELALRKTYDATPEPRLVVAVGACGCSGGMFGVNYATRGAVDAVVPVDVYIPGCPPNPHALLHGLLLALGRLPAKR